MFWPLIELELTLQLRAATYNSVKEAQEHMTCPAGWGADETQ